jgi:hypothetical protein
MKERREIAVLKVTRLLKDRPVLNRKDKKLAAQV